MNIINGNDSIMAETDSIIFDVRLADAADIPNIMKLMTEVKANMPQKEWFVDDNEEYLHDLLNGKGFILLAISETPDHFVAQDLEHNLAKVSECLDETSERFPEKHSKHLAAFFMVKFPGISEDNLGHHLGFSQKQLEQCVHMDSCVVHPAFRGQHLQSRMASLAEQQIREMPYHYLLGTIHPDNCYSMNSMIRCGYRIVKETYLYGGLPRAILCKEI